jgi:SAM-dependent methyltransferase
VLEDQPADATDAYTVTAEFYEILQAESERRLSEHRFARAAAQARLGIVDVGAGTGIVTEVVLARSAAPVHAVEPSEPMRVALMARLAGLPADRRARVSVHPSTLQDAGLEQVADLAVCPNLAGLVEPGLRPALWRAIAAALVPGGVLLLEPPPHELPAAPASRKLPPVRVGPELFSAQIDTRADGDHLAVTYTYRVERDGEVVREERERFTMWVADPGTIRAELREAGLSLDGSAPKGLARLRREGSADG